jgi:hypothetical protein
LKRISIPGKHASETISQVFDFISLLAIGETLSTASVAATVYSGTDASPSSIISGSASISGTKVTQLITGGTLGVTYTLVCTVTTSASQTLQLMGFLAVVPSVN